MTLKLARLFLCLSLAAVVMPVAADEKQDLENLRQTTLRLMQLLVQQGVLTQDKVDELMRQAQQPAPAAAAVAPSAAPAGAAPGAAVVRVPYVPQVVRDEIKQEIRDEVLAQAKTERWGEPAAYPEWIRNMQWEGDVRLRYQQDILQSTNAPPQFFQGLGYTNVTNTTENDERFRLRGRFGFQTQIDDWVTVGVRIASGTTGSSASSTGNPVSQNQTLGNAYFGRNPVGLDLAYIKLAPTGWLSVSGGRVANPWFSTDLLWAPDLSFDGFTSTARPKLSENTSGFATLGAFPLQHFDPNPLNNSAGNKWLYGAQLGLDHHTADKSRVRVGLALYDYVHTEGIANTGAAGSVQATLFNQTAPQFLQKGNTLFPINVFGDAPLFGLASRFKEINLTGEIDFARFDPVHVIVTGDYVKNIGFKSGEILQRTGQALNGRTTGYQGKVMVGWPRIEKQGQWQLFGSYKYVERDAVLDAFTETDFHLGGTDARGYVIGGSYGIARNTWVSLRWSSSNSIDLPPLAVDLLQVDLNARF